MMEDQEMSLKSAVDKLDNNVRLVSLSKSRKKEGNGHSSMCVMDELSKGYH